MKLLKLITLLLVGAFFSLPVSANLASDLNDGQHVLLMRHADAPGYGDPQGYRLDQCSSQRNLGDYGKKQSVAIGEWLTGQGNSLKHGYIFGLHSGQTSTDAFQD
mgnify:CR=1 FL=1